LNIADLNQEARDLCDATTTSYTAATLLRRVNSALETLVGKIIGISGTWDYDDTNYTDLPVGKGTLVEGQSSYTFASNYLQIKNIKILGVDGTTWGLIYPTDQSQEYYPLENELVTDGSPYKYDKVGDTINLYPAPTATSVTLASGIKIEFKRTGSIFTSAEVTTGTKEPGIASPWHITIAKMAALPYCKSYKKDRVTQLERDIAVETASMLKHYGQRERDSRKIMSMEQINHR